MKFLPNAVRHWPHLVLLALLLPAAGDSQFSETAGVALRLTAESGFPERESDRVVYREQFNPAAGTVSADWSDEKTTTAPGEGVEFRGPFLARPVALSLGRLPEHSWVRMRFKLLVIGSWDGCNRVWGPDLWSLQVRGGQRLIFSSFGNMGDFSNNDSQSFPDSFPWGKQKAWTGASGKNVLGLPKDGGSSTRENQLNDGVYPIEVVFPHAGESLILDFAGIYDDPPGEKQSWGLGEMEVVALTEPPVVEDGALPELWTGLASADAVLANVALWKMVAAGDRTVAFITDRIAELEKGVADGKRGTPPVTGLEAVRLHRAHRLLRVINRKTGALCFAIDHLFPEYFRDLDDR